MESVFLIITCLIFVVYIFVRLFRNNRRSKLLRKLPGPKPLPILGNMLLFNVPRHELLPAFAKLRDEYGNIFLTLHGSRHLVNLFSPNDIETILGANKHTRKGKAYDFLLPWLGTGLLISSGEKWYSHRKLITPTFHFKILEGFLDVFNESCQKLVTNLREKSGKGYFNISPFITRCALDIICETAMGSKINAQENEESAYVAATLRISELIVDRQFTLWHHPDYIYYNSAKGKEFKRILATLHGFTEKVIKDRKEQRKLMKSTARSEECDSMGMKKRLAFLDLLLESDKTERVPLTDLEIREEVDTFMFEGHDTTTMAIDWCLLLLGNHPEIQSAVREELEGIFKGEGRSVTLRDLGEMKLLERVIKETLRLYPSVPFITRISDEDINLGGYKIPAETNIAIHIYNMHRSPEVYPNPLKFDPDRFLPQYSNNRHPYAYLPFSAGQRNCIGQKFALYEEKVVLSAILRNFIVESEYSADKVPVSQEVVTRPKNGISVKLTPISI